MRTHTDVWTRAFALNVRLDGTGREVAAATVTDGTTDFTPEPGVDDTLWARRAGSVTVQRT